MVDVRKCLVVLALFALIAGGAFAQVTCTVQNAAQNTLIRDGGLTEQVGVLQMSCVNPGNPVAVSFSSIMNTTVSNPLGTGSVAKGATLTVGTETPATGVLQTGPAAQFRNQIIFDTVEIPSTGATGTVPVTINGIRVVAPALPTSSFAVQTVSETITTTGATDTTTGVPTTVTVTNPVQLVATVQPGLTSALATCGGSTSDFAVSSFSQCISEPATPGGSWNANIQFKEGFAFAFKNADDEGANSTNGTLLVANFAKIPAGARIFVTESPVIAATTAPLPTETNPTATGVVPSATLNTDFTDVLRGSLPTGSTAPVCGETGQEVATSAWSELAVDSDGTASASWEVTAENPAYTDTMQFGILVVYTSNTAAQLPGVTTTSGPATISTELGPVAGPAFATSSSSQLIPRFNPNVVFTGNLFTIQPCVTNLLFPYVTNAAGFDTGVAISNTSLDAGTDTQPLFNTTTQSGTCTAFYFTSSTATAAAPAPQTTGVIGAGEVFTFLLSAGGVQNAGSTVPANFTGYMIVRCNFQFAHGFAFISDLGAQKLAMGYLALVIPDATRKPAPFSRFDGNVGEILGN